MKNLYGRQIKVTIAEPFELSKRDTSYTATIIKTVKSSTGILLAAKSKNKILLIATKYLGEDINNIMNEPLVVHVAELKGDENLLADELPDGVIRNIGSGVARLINDCV